MSFPARDPRGQPARFNMPFEMGLACSIVLAGGPHDVVVLDTVPYRLDRTLSDYKGRDPLIYHHRVDSLIDCMADVFQVAHEPTPNALKAEARILRKSAREIARQYGGTIFRPVAFRALVAVATARARSQGLITP